ncbi:MAG: protocatechuate dioxygenase [Gordonia sp. (in: high G+C Gram-positive bacteria)]
MAAHKSDSPFLPSGGFRNEEDHHRSDALGGGVTTNRRALLRNTGLLSLTGLLAACSTEKSTTAATSSSSAAASASATFPNRAATSVPATPLAASDNQILDSLLAKSPTCPLTVDVTQGPYWFDVNYIRSDIREDKPGLPLELAIKVVDLNTCSATSAGDPITDAVVEIWHCDALGVYSGFEETSKKLNGGLDPKNAPPPPRQGAAAMKPHGTPSDGAYSAGDRQSKRTDNHTYLRGAQPTDRSGIVRFTTNYPGWYFSRTVHIHLRVHIHKKLVLTTQLYFDDALNTKIFKERSPYNQHVHRDTFNNIDKIFKPTGLVTVQEATDKVYGGINLGVKL